MDSPEKDSPDEAPTRLGAKGDRAKEALKLAARQVFWEKGYGPARVQDITNKAGFSLGAFYRYYADKDAVLNELVDQWFVESYATTFHRSRYDPINPAKSVYRSIIQTLHFIARNADILKVLWETSQTYESVEQRWRDLRDQLNKRVTRAILRAQDDRIVFPELDPSGTAELLIGMTENAAYHHIARGGESSREELERLAKRLTLVWAHALFIPDALSGIADILSGVDSLADDDLGPVPIPEFRRGPAAAPAPDRKPARKG